MTNTPFEPAELASHLPRGGGDARFGAGALVGEGVGR